MMEKVNVSYRHFQKKIVPYLDGSLPAQEAAEFEAFVATHPEFENLVKNKEKEIELLKSMIPSVSASQDSLESLENEMRASVYNLLKEEPQGFLDSMKLKLEDWLSR